MIAAIVVDFHSMMGRKTVHMIPGILLSLALLLITAAPVAGADAASALPDQTSPISLAADSLVYDAEVDSYEARGDVVLRQGDVELTSQELLWQASTQDASARGEVLLQDKDMQLSAELVQYNLATGQGQMRQGEVLVSQDNFHFSGDVIEKQGQADYFVANGSFTTCDGEIPDWKFSAREVDVTLGGYARAKHVFFHVKDVPVLYTPYLFFPVKTERESGFLAPWFGHSSKKGLRASLAWYQVIDRNMDATFYLDYLSKSALGKGLEYRYALARQNNGRALYYHATGIDETPNMYYLEWQHRGDLLAGWRWTADIEYTETQRFFEEFGENPEDYNRDKMVSRLILQRNWQKLNLVGHARYLKDLETDNDGTLQRLPEIGLAQARYRIGETPLSFGLESYATHFWREEGEEGERLYLRPFVTATFKAGPWFEIVPEAALYQRLYHADRGDDSETIPEVSLTLATRLIRNFAVNRWGLDRVRHSIEPEISYTYIGDEDQTTLPLFDLYDRLEERNDITYALVNRLTALSSPAGGTPFNRDLLYLRLSQSYDLDAVGDPETGRDKPFSELHLELDFWPTEKNTLHVESLIPFHGDTRFRNLSIGITAEDFYDHSVTIDYIYRDEDFNNEATDYVRFQMDTPLLKPVFLRFGERYDLHEGRELEKVFGVEYRARCWSLLVTYRDRYEDETGDDQEVMINFVLAGLGQNEGFAKGFESSRQ